MGAVVKRGSGGRFAKGTKAGPGPKPGGGRVAKMKAALLDATSIAQAKRIFQKLGDMAEGGSLPAIKLYLRYIAGDPRHAYDPRQVQPAAPEAPKEQDSLRDQEIFLRGMLAHVQAEMRAEQERSEGDG